MEAKYKIRCNKCMTKFVNDDDLAIIKENGQFVKACPKCKIDGFLMDAPFIGSSY
jgi:hypothetical protein